LRSRPIGDKSVMSPPGSPCPASKSAIHRTALPATRRSSGCAVERRSFTRNQDVCMPPRGRQLGKAPRGGSRGPRSAHPRPARRAELILLRGRRPAAHFSCACSTVKFAAFWRGAGVGKWRLAGFADRRDDVHTDINPWRKRSQDARCHGKSSCAGHRMTSWKRRTAASLQVKACSTPVRASVLRCAQRTTAAIRYQWTSVTSLCCLSNGATGMCCPIPRLDEGVST
jgi:hypothetical protein